MDLKFIAPMCETNLCLVCSAINLYHLRVLLKIGFKQLRTDKSTYKTAIDFQKGCSQ